MKIEFSSTIDRGDDELKKEIVRRLKEEIKSGDLKRYAQKYPDGVIVIDEIRQKDDPTIAIASIRAPQLKEFVIFKVVRGDIKNNMMESGIIFIKTE